MDWAKAKTYIILLLFILNILLCGFNVYKSQKYYTDGKSAKFTKQILQNENISLECSLPAVFKPMKNISFKKYNYDILMLKDIFFDESDNIKQTIEFEDRILYTDSGKRLTVSGNKVTFESSLENADSDKIINDMIKKIEKNFCVMKKLRDDTDSGTRMAVFNQEFNGRFIFNNYISFLFSPSNDYSIEFMYCEPQDFTGEKNEIYSPCEAAFNFSSEILKVYDMEEYIITNMDLGYFFENGENIHESIYVSKPYYRIFIKGIKEPFYISALDNTFYYEG